VGSALRRLLKSAPDTPVAAQIQRAGAAQPIEVSLSPKTLLEVLTAGALAEVPKVAGITDEAHEATGLKREDKIVAIEGEPATAARLAEIQQSRIGDTITVIVER